MVQGFTLHFSFSSIYYDGVRPGWGGHVLHGLHCALALEEYLAFIKLLKIDPRYDTDLLPQTN